MEEDGACVGVVCWDLLNGGLKLLSGKSTVLATGGLGRIFRVTTNAYACTGDGAAMALRVGVPLKDMEFMQYHPTTLYPSGILLTEGCRGEGAYLINSEGDRFMAKYAPNAMELASRDVVSRSEQTEIDEGRGVNSSVLLDMRHLGAEKILTRLPGSRELSVTYAGVDPIYDPVPVRPGARSPHGRRGDRQRRRDRAGGALRRRRGCLRLRPRLQPAGRKLAHGDDHLRRRAGRAAAESALAHNPAVVTAPPSALDDARRDLVELLDRNDGERPWEDPRELGSSMLENFGLFRRRGSDGSQLGIIEGLRDRYEHVVVEDKGDVFNSDLTQAPGARLSHRPGRRHDQRRHRAQGEPWRTLGLTITPDRDDENFLKHSITTMRDRRPSCPGRMCA